MNSLLPNLIVRLLLNMYLHLMIVQIQYYQLYRIMNIINFIKSNLNTEDEVRSTNGYLQDAGSTDTNACQD